MKKTLKTNVLPVLQQPQAQRKAAKRLLNKIDWQRVEARKLLARADELEEELQMFLLEHGGRPL